MNKQDLEAIKERVEKATPGPWFHSEEIYVVANVQGDFIEWNADFVSETDRSEDAEFIAKARQDIPNLVETVESYRKIILELGRLSERYSYEEFDFDKRYIMDKTTELESICEEIYKRDRESRGLTLCEECLEEFPINTSICKTVCSTCVDKSDMEKNQWEENDDEFDFEYDMGDEYDYE